MNRDLMLRIADQIEQEPRLYRQQDWSYALYEDGHPCGTAFCIAGWAAHLEGWQPPHRPDLTDRSWTPPAELPPGFDFTDCDLTAPDAVAQVLLGIDSGDELAMFESFFASDIPKEQVPALLRAVAFGADAGEAYMGTVAMGAGALGELLDWYASRHVVTAEILDS